MTDPMRNGSALCELIQDNRTVAPGAVTGGVVSAAPSTDGRCHLEGRMSTPPVQSRKDRG